MAFTESTNGGRPLKGGVVQLGNFTGLQAATFGVTSTLLFLTIGSVVLRFWSRRIKKIRIMANDIFAAAALFSLLGFFSLVIYGVCAGMGRHAEELQNVPLQLPQLMKLMVPLPILWSTINTLVKISILDLYYMVFPNRSLQIGTFTLLAASCIWWIISILFAFLNCRPFSYTWDKVVHPESGHCVDAVGGTLGFGIVNLILDVAVIALPLRYLYTLHLKLSKRISLIGIFGLGFVITAISAVRIKKIVSADGTYGLAQIALWSFVETSLSVMNCCLPTIQPALMATHKRLAGMLGGQPKVTSAPSRRMMITMTTPGPSNTSPPQSRGASPMPDYPTKPYSLLDQREVDLENVGRTKSYQ